MNIDNDLWRYALTLYGQDKVEPACLQLQAAGLSINMLIFCIWLGLEGRTFEPDRLTRAGQWRAQITGPVRGIRYQVRDCKAQAAAWEPCYVALKKAEMACEQVEVALLCEAAFKMRAAEPGEVLILENLARYLNGCTLDSDRQPVPALCTLLEAVLTKLPENWMNRLGLRD
ncbi:MAG: TIGR02444 family protein [Pontibacterium sp.]